MSTGWGKNSVKWFFGFKLHLVINDSGELLGFNLTPGNVDDRKPVSKITKNIFGLIFGDKGYIDKKLFKQLFTKGLKLITPFKSNMKNRLVSLIDKILLRKRSLIETVNDQLKNISQIEHSRHRSVINFLTNEEVEDSVTKFCISCFKNSNETSIADFKGHTKAKRTAAPEVSSGTATEQERTYFLGLCFYLMPAIIKF